MSQKQATFEQMDSTRPFAICGGFIQLMLIILLVVLPVLLCFAPLFPRSQSLALVVGLLTCTSFFLLVLKQFELWVGLLFVVLCFFPAEAVGLLSGYYYSAASGMVNISLAGYTAVIMFCHILVFSAKYGLHFDEQNTMSAIAFFTVLLITRFLADGFEGLLSNKLFENYLMPLLVFFVITCLPRIDHGKVLRMLLAFLVVDALIACFEYIVSSNLFYHDYFMANNAWYQQIIIACQYGNAYRSSSCIGHPLTVALFMNVGFILTEKTVKNVPAKLGFDLLFLLALLTTNSRAGLLVFACFLIFFAYKKSFSHLALGLLIIVVALSLLFWRGNMYEALFSRDSSGSSLLQRVLGLNAFLSSSMSQIVLGVGFSGSQSLVSSFTNSSGNMEIGPLIVLSEIGILAFAVFVLFLVQCVRHLYLKRKIAGETDSYISVILLLLICIGIECCTYNSIGDTCQIMYLPMALLGLACVTPSAEE